MENTTMIYCADCDTMTHGCCKCAICGEIKCSECELANLGKCDINCKQGSSFVLSTTAVTTDTHKEVFTYSRSIYMLKTATHE